MAWEKLTTTNIVQLVGGVGAVILAGIIGFFVHGWLQADVRFEEGPYYRSGAEAIVSLKIQNYGYTDAKAIKIATNFPKPLVKPPVSSDDTYPCSVISGGKGEESASVLVERLVPNQSLYLYYAIENPKRPITGENDKFVSSMTYEGGKGKRGPPTSFSIVVTLAVTVLSSLVTVSLTYFTAKLMNRAHKSVMEALTKSNETIKTLTEGLTKADAVVQAVSAERDELRRQLDQLKAASGGAPAGVPAPVSKPSAAPQLPAIAPKPKKKS